MSDELFTAETVEFANGRRLAELEKELREAHERELRDLRSNAEALAKLRNGGVKTQSYGGEVLYMDVSTTELIRIRSILGNFTITGKSVAGPSEKIYAGIDIGIDCVSIRLANAQYPGLIVSHIKPIKPSDPCQIVKTTSTKATLVCDIAGRDSADASDAFLAEPAEASA